MKAETKRLLRELAAIAYLESLKREKQVKIMQQKVRKEQQKAIL